MGILLNERKDGKYAELSNAYKEAIKGPVTVTYGAGKSIDLSGHNTIGDFNAALIATKVDNTGKTDEELALCEVRVRDMYKTAHIVTIAELELIIALGCSAGNSLWNKKVDLQEECLAILLENYADEAAAIAAVEAITW